MKNKERGAAMLELLEMIREWIIDDPKVALAEIDNLLGKVR